MMWAHPSSQEGPERPPMYGSGGVRIARGTRGARGTVQGVICPGDADWYEIGRYNEGASISATVTFDGAAANLDAWLFVGDLNGLAQVAFTDRSPEVLPTGAPRTGTYYVLVQVRSSYDTADYTLTIR